MSRIFFSKRLSELRKQKKLTMQQLADELDMGSSTIAMLEKGARSPSFELLIAIADFFGVSIDYLTGRTDEPDIDFQRRRIEAECIKILSERLSRHRIDKDFTLQHVGDAIGATRHDVSLFEKGEKTPTFEQLLALSDLFGVSFDYLLSDTDADPKNYKPLQTEKEKRALYDRLLNPKWDFEERMERDEKNKGDSSENK